MMNHSYMHAQRPAHTSALTLLLARYIAGEISEPMWINMSEQLDATPATDERTMLAQTFLHDIETPAAADVAEEDLFAAFDAIVMSSDEYLGFEQFVSDAYSDPSVARIKPVDERELTDLMDALYTA